jgi:CBS domain-containing protein
MDNNKKNTETQINTISEKVVNSPRETLGVINQEFLLQSLGSLARKQPVCLDQDTLVTDAVITILESKVGSALLLDQNLKVVGIFTERDYLKHFAKGERDPKSTKLKEVSTMNPVLVTPETTLAYGLNLMSLGGFRHLPVIDETGHAIGVVSVRDVIDRISESLVNDLLAFELPAD